MCCFCWCFFFLFLFSLNYYINYNNSLIFKFDFDKRKTPIVIIWLCDVYEATNRFNYCSFFFFFLSCLVVVIVYVCVFCVNLVFLLMKLVYMIFVIHIKVRLTSFFILTFLSLFRFQIGVDVCTTFIFSFAIQGESQSFISIHADVSCLFSFFYSV